MNVLAMSINATPPSKCVRTREEWSCRGIVTGDGGHHTVLMDFFTHSES